MHSRPSLPYENGAVRHPVPILCRDFTVVPEVCRLYYLARGKELDFETSAVKSLEPCIRTVKVVAVEVIAHAINDGMLVKMLYLALPKVSIEARIGADMPCIVRLVEVVFAATYLANVHFHDFLLFCRQNGGGSDVSAFLLFRTFSKHSKTLCGSSLAQVMRFEIGE